MLKVRIIAVVIAIVLTLLTIQLIPIVVHHYTHFMDGLDKEEQALASWLQAGIGFIVAACAFWQWRKKRKNEK